MIHCCQPSPRKLLNFRDIGWNGYHIEIVNRKDIGYFYITNVVLSEKFVLKKNPFNFSFLANQEQK